MAGRTRASSPGQGWSYLLLLVLLAVGTVARPGPPVSAELPTSSRCETKSHSTLLLRGSYRPVVRLPTAISR